MPDYKEIINNADASDLTSMLKNDFGKGSMKNGLIKLISDSEKLNDMQMSNNSKNTLIYFLSTAVAALAAYIGYDKLKKKEQAKLNQQEKEQMIKDVENLSEEEVENIVIEALKDDEMKGDEIENSKKEK